MGLRAMRRRGVPWIEKICLAFLICTAWPGNLQPVSAEPPKTRLTYEGKVRQGEAFVRPFGPGFSFRLEPIPLGWEIAVVSAGRTENLARLTPPLHGPNARFLEGWHFRNTDNNGPNTPGEKNVNAPGLVRDFIFSPEVGRTIDGPQARRPPSWEDIEKVREFGQGVLTILEYGLTNLEPGEKAGFAWLRFQVELSWPETPHQPPQINVPS